jgi:hypothetical protein
MKKAVLILLLCPVALSAGLFSGMDLRVDVVPMGNQYGNVRPRVSPKNCSFFTKEQAPEASAYTVLAQYVVQELPTTMISHSAQDMICYAYATAVKKGADGIIVDEIGTANMSAGNSAKTSPLIKLRSIRFIGDLPSKGEDEEDKDSADPKAVNNPVSKVMKSFYEYLNAGEYSKAEKYCTASFLKKVEAKGGTQKLADQYSRDGQIKRIVIHKLTIRGEGAKVIIRIFYKDDVKATDTASLIKKNGTWLINE